MKNKIIFLFILCVCFIHAKANIIGLPGLCVGSSSSFTDDYATVPSGGSWSSSDPTIASISSSGEVTGISGGVATITYSNGGSYDVTTIGITTLSVTSSSPVCTGSTLNLTSTLNFAEINYGYSYSWSGPNSFSSTYNQIGFYPESTTSITATTGANGIYTLTVTAQSGCALTATISVTVDVPAAAITGTTNICAGSTSLLSDATTDGTWSSTNASTATIDPSGGIVTGIAAGVTTISYLVANSCGTTVATTSYTVNPLPTAAAITGTANICAGGTTLLSDATNGGVWSSGSSSIASVNSSGTVTGIAAGTVLISYAVTNSCGTAVATVSYTVNPVPIATVTATSFVCGGGTINITSGVTSGTPSYVYSWSGPSGFTSSLQNPSITPATGGASGDYSLTVTDANGCIATEVTSSVTVDVITSVPSSNSPVCTGGTLSLYGGSSGGTIFSWAGPAGYTSTVQNPSPVTHSTVAGTYVYTLTVTDNHGCIIPAATTSVTVGAPLSMSVTETLPWTLTGEPFYSKCGSSISFLASGAYSGTYTWTPSAGLNVTNVATVTATNTVTTTYVVTGYYNGCTGSLNVPVMVYPTSCNPCNYFKVAYSNPTATCTDCSTTQPFHSYTVPSFSSSNLPTDGIKNIYLAASTTITGTMNWNGYILFIASGDGITIANNANVTFDNSHLFSCNWQGITVSVNSTNAGQLTLEDNTLIENASSQYEGGVAINSGSEVSPGAAAPASGDILYCDATIFNNDYTGIYISYWPASSYTSTATSTTLPFQITGSVFTSRNMTIYNNGSTSSANYYPFTWPASSALSTLTSSTDPYSPVYGVNTYTVTTSPSDGIYFNGGLTITSGSANTYYELVVGQPTSGKGNVFDNIGNWNIFSQYGGNISVYNNVFINPTGGIADNRSGIHLKNTYNYLFRAQILGSGSLDGTYGNKFYNYYYGVYTNGYNDFKGWESTMSQIDANYGDALSGYNVNLGSFNSVDIEYNSLSNISNLAIAVSAYDATSCNIGNIEIGNNYITSGTVSATVSSPQCLTGIQYADYRTYTVTNTYSVTGTCEISNNSINSIFQNGIHAAGGPPSSLSYPTTIETNTVTMVNSSYANNAYGIYAAGVTQGNIENNIVSGPGYATPTCSVSGTSSYGIAGIYANAVGTPSNNASFNISCNTTHDIGFGFLFNGTSYLTWIDNIMLLETYGMCLLNGSIGQQGNAGNPIDNYWEDGGTYPTYWWTSTSGVYQVVTGSYASPSLSKLYVRNESPQNKPTNIAPYGYNSSTVLTSTVSPTSYPYPSCTGQTTSSHRESNGDSTGSLSSINIDQHYVISPNPSDGNIIIAQEVADNAPVNLRVMNDVGAVVYSGTMQFTEGKYRLNLDDAITGMYLVQITDSGGNIKTYKIIIEK